MGGWHHHSGPHGCAFGNHEQCPYWAQLGEDRWAEG